MLNSGFRGKRAADGTGAISIQNQSFQIANPVIKINSWSVTNNSYVPYDDTAVTAGAIVVVYGNNFVSGMTVYVGSAIVSSVFLDVNRITFTAPVLSNGTYNIYISTPQGNAAILSPGIVYSGFPTWTTTNYSTIANTVYVQLMASGDGPLTFSLQQGSTLPTGITLTSTGLLTGTATGISTESVFTFTVIAEDIQLQGTQQLITLSFLFNDIYFKYTTLLLNGEIANTPFINDASTNSLSLTINGDTKPALFNPYQGGYYSNYFDGTGDYLSIASNAVFQFGTGDFTIEAWVYMSGGTSGTIFDNRTGTTSTHPVLFFNTSTTVTYYVAGATVIASGAYTFLNKWVHVALIRNSGITKMFFDGVQTGSNYTDTNNFSTSGTVLTGAGYAGANLLTGYISNLRVVNGTAVYTSTFTPSTTPLTAIANTSLLTCQSNRFIDKSTNNFTVTKNGDTTISPNIPFTPDSSYSTYGSAYFDGTTDYVTSPASASNIPSGDFTVEIWAYPTSIPAQVGLVGINNTTSSGAGNFGLYIETSRQVTIFISGNTTTYSTASAVITIGAWNHVAVVRSGSTNTIYVNGVSVYTNTASPGWGGTPVITVGRLFGDNTGVCFYGYLSDARVTKAAVYTTAFTPPTTLLTSVTNTQLLTLQYNGSANNNGIIDNSLFQNVITRNGNPTQGSFSPFSMSGWSNYFDGTGDYLSGTASQLNFGANDFSIEFWINAYNTSTNSQIIFQAGTGNLAILLMTGGVIEPGQYQTAGISDSTVGAIVVNSWHHVVVTRTGTAFRTFIDGVLQGYGARSFSPNNSGFSIGGASAGTNFTGYISNFRVIVNSIPSLYSTASTTIGAVIFTPPTLPLTAIANTGLLTCQSNRFIDNGPNNTTLTRNGDVSVQSFSPFGSIQEPIPIGNSTNFNGSTYLNTTGATAQTAMLFGSGDFTIEAWINPVTSGATRGICNNWQTGGAFVYELTSSNTLNFNYTNVASGISTISYTGTTVISTNVWTHVAIVRSGSFLYHYINGVLDAGGRVAFNGTSIFYYNGTVKDLKIGVSGDTANYFTGCISNLRIIKGQAIYTGNFTPSTTPLTTTSQGAVAANVSLLTCQSTVLDNSTNGFTLNITGTPKVVNNNPFGYTNISSINYTPSTHGGSIYYDGTGDYITATNANFAFGASNDFTAECWAYFTVVNASQSPGLICVANAGTSNGWEVYYDTTTWGVRSNTANVFTSPGSPPVPGQWYHVAYVRKSGTHAIYVNGVRLATSASVYTWSDTVFYSGYVPIGQNVYGYVSNLRLINGTCLYSSNFSPPVAPFTNYSASVIPNLLLNFTGAAIVDQHGSVVLETVGNVQISNAVKKYGNSSIYFDGTGDYLSMPTNQLMNFGTGSFTVEAWINTSYSGNIQTIFNISDTGSLGYGAVRVQVLANQSIQWLMGPGGSWGVNVTAGSIVLGSWQHIAVTRNGSSVYFFINGTQVGTTQTYSTSLTSGGLTYIGFNSGTAYYFYGYIDELRVTPGFARYTANFTPYQLLVR